jgi:hypothetical protein
MLTTLKVNNKNLLEITNNFKSIDKKIDSGNGNSTFKWTNLGTLTD